MSLDRSLKTAGNLVSKRSVLTRAERFQKLKENGKRDFEKKPVLHLPKVKSASS